MGRVAGDITAVRGLLERPVGHRMGVADGSDPDSLLDQIHIEMVDPVRAQLLQLDFTQGGDYVPFRQIRVLESRFGPQRCFDSF